eukprot:TRINITY_DN17490_c0_g3_i1.p1 TRINITY_DN17490_c0_g3~~TRINITY_DN17490_c0_g3_i1.p1  ORF type:complete len:403 (+),score=71.57 TRINITY_DN17490_c0_g3_i1:166-1209(+)
MALLQPGPMASKERPPNEAANAPMSTKNSTSGGRSSSKVAFALRRDNSLAAAGVRRVTRRLTVPASIDKEDSSGGGNVGITSSEPTPNAAADDMSAAARARALALAAMDRGADVFERTTSIAKKYRLEPHEVRPVLQAVSKHCAGKESISLPTFKKFMCEVFAVPEVQDNVVQSAYKTCCAQGSFDEECFFSWYVQHMFTQVATLNGCSAQNRHNRMIYDLAAKHEVKVAIIDKIREKFNRFDVDKSGGIDFWEFSDMLAILLRARAVDLSEERSRKFWKEIDTDGDGSIDFEEFTTWYIKYFLSDGQEVAAEAGGPIEALYASYNPSVQRWNSIEQNLKRRATMPV